MSRNRYLNIQHATKKLRDIYFPTDGNFDACASKVSMYLNAGCISILDKDGNPISLSVMPLSVTLGVEAEDAKLIYTQSHGKIVVQVHSRTQTFFPDLAKEGAHIDLHAAMKAFEADGYATPEGESFEHPVKEPSRAGRKRSTIVQDLEDALFSHIRENGKPEIQADSERWVANYCGENGLEEPAESTIRDLVKRAYDRLNEEIDEMDRQGRKGRK